MISEKTTISPKQLTIETLCTECKILQRFSVRLSTEVANFLASPSKSFRRLASTCPTWGVRSCLCSVLGVPLLEPPGKGGVSKIEFLIKQLNNQNLINRFF